ncbi:MAG: threonine/serine exporter family protein [Eubacterium sp.]|nr:threonine/serine exporter family protein [Eubacterium sp.]
MIKEIVLCTAGATAFAVTMRVKTDSIAYVIIGSLITSYISIALNETTGEFYACTLAMLILSFYCEICSRLIKKPRTVILLPSTIPLLPGSYIYYSILGVINENREMFLQYARRTAAVGTAIALGTVISSIIMIIIKDIKEKL